MVPPPTTSLHGTSTYEPDSDVLSEESSAAEPDTVQAPGDTALGKDVFDRSVPRYGSIVSSVRGDAAALNPGPTCSTATPVPGMRAAVVPVVEGVGLEVPLAVAPTELDGEMEAVPDGVIVAVGVFDAVPLLVAVGLGVLDRVDVAVGVPVGTGVCVGSGVERASGTLAARATPRKS